jgi:ABC-type branched-subunit amino acid transport system ATPase component
MIMDRSAVIEIDRLTKRFGAVTALDDLSFTVRPGHVTGFLGPNRAGKTNLGRRSTIIARVQAVVRVERRVEPRGDGPGWRSQGRSQRPASHAAT